MPLTSSSYYSLSESVNQSESFCERTQHGQIVDMKCAREGSEGGREDSAVERRKDDWRLLDFIIYPQVVYHGIF